jgi:hypothetical protein
MSAAMKCLRRALGVATIAFPLAAASLQAQHDMGGGSTLIRGFTDVDYSAGDRNSGSRPGFRLGQFDLYISSPLTERFSFVSETVFEFDEAAGSFALDVERVIVNYALDEHFRLSGGKVHTPIGFWNNAYHHGQALSPTIERPFVFRFEDEGGPLPVHTTGVQVSGRDLTAGHVGFDILLGNGLGNHPVPDTNATASLTLALHSQLTPSLRAGVSGYRDHAVAGTPTPRGDLLLNPMTQLIGGGFVTYFADRLEGIAEYQQVRNSSVGVTTASPGWFLYGGVRMGARLVPYVVHDQLRLAANDPYFAPNDVKRETLGLRFEQSAAVVLKLELRSTDRPGLARATDGGIQLAVAF